MSDEFRDRNTPRRDPPTPHPAPTGPLARHSADSPTAPRTVAQTSGSCRVPCSGETLVSDGGVHGLGSVCPFKASLSRDTGIEYSSQNNRKGLWLLLTAKLDFVQLNSVPLLTLTLLHPSLSQPTLTSPQPHLNTNS